MGYDCVTVLAGACKLHVCTLKGGNTLRDRSILFQRLMDSSAINESEVSIAGHALSCRCKCQVLLPFSVMRHARFIKGKGTNSVQFDLFDLLIPEVLKDDGINSFQRFRECKEDSVGCF